MPRAVWIQQHLEAELVVMTNADVSMPLGGVLNLLGVITVEDGRSSLIWSEYPETPDPLLTIAQVEFREQINTLIEEITILDGRSRGTESIVTVILGSVARVRLIEGSILICGHHYYYG